MSDDAPLSLEEAARVRLRGEVARRDAVNTLMRSIQAHSYLGATEIARRLEAAGWSVTRGQVHNLLKGRTR